MERIVGRNQKWATNPIRSVQERLVFRAMNVDSIVQLPFNIAQPDFNETPNVPPEHAY
jgi:hypothetical protein